MKKYDCIIGVDPGTKTGLAAWTPDNNRLLIVKTCSIIEAMDKVDDAIWHYGNVLVRIENPNLRKKFGNTARERLQGAGSIKRDYSIWIEFLKSRNIPYEDVAPKNIQTKVKPDYFKKLTGWEGRTSNHSRDAAMLCFKYQ